MGRQCYLYLLLLTTYIFFSQVRNVSINLMMAAKCVYSFGFISLEFDTNFEIRDLNLL